MIKAVALQHEFYPTVLDALEDEAAKEDRTAAKMASILITEAIVARRRKKGKRVN